MFAAFRYELIYEFTNLRTDSLILALLRLLEIPSLEVSLVSFPFLKCITVAFELSQKARPRIENVLEEQSRDYCGRKYSNKTDLKV